MKLGADGGYPIATDLSNEIARLRANLTPAEGERFCVLGCLCADAMNSAIRAVQPGQSEYEIAARLGHEMQARGAQPIVNLIGTDERIFQFRHPLPTDKKLDKYVMLVLCGRKWGLVCSITRLFGNNVTASGAELATFSGRCVSDERCAGNENELLPR